MSKDKLVMNPFKKDLLASLLVGLIAGPLALVTLNTLEVVLPLGIPNYAMLVIFPIVTVAGIIVGRFLARFVTIMYKFVKFGEVGGLNFLVDLGVLNLLISWTGVSDGPMYSVFKATSFTAAVTNSYFWNKLWVFSDAKAQDKTKEAGKFLVASLLGMAFNVALASAIVFFGPMVFEGIDSTVWASIGSVVGSISAILFNFVLYKIWVFRD